MTGPDLHPNAIDPTTGTELTVASQTTYDRRWLQTIGGTITPTSNSTTTLKVTKADGTTQVFDIDTTNARVGVGTNAPDATLKVTGVTAISSGFDGMGDIYSNRNVSGGSLEIGYDATNNYANIVALTENIAWRRLHYRALDHIFQAGSGPTQGAVTFSSQGRVGVGLGLNGANSMIQVAGAIATAVTSKTAAYTLTASDATVLGDTTSGAFTLTLPTAVGITGRIYTVKRGNGGSNNLMVSGTSAQTFDGATTKTLGAQYAALTVQSDGANWQILSTLGTVS
jgi:hypothetical protein